MVVVFVPTYVYVIIGGHITFLINGPMCLMTPEVEKFNDPLVLVLQNFKMFNYPLFLMIWEAEKRKVIFYGNVNAPKLWEV